MLKTLTGEKVTLTSLAMAIIIYIINYDQLVKAKLYSSDYSPTLNRPDKISRFCRTCLLSNWRLRPLDCDSCVSSCSHCIRLSSNSSSSLSKSANCKTKFIYFTPKISHTRTITTMPTNNRKMLETSNEKTKCGKSLITEAFYLSLLKSCCCKKTKLSVI